MKVAANAVASLKQDTHAGYGYFERYATLAGKSHDNLCDYLEKLAVDAGHMRGESLDMVRQEIDEAEKAMDRLAQESQTLSAEYKKAAARKKAYSAFDSGGTSFRAAVVPPGNKQPGP